MLKRFGLSKAFVLFLIFYALVGVVVYLGTKTNVDYRSRAGTENIQTVVMNTVLRTDVANQDGQRLDIDQNRTSWVGTGRNQNASYVGIRFVGLRLPADVDIVSAILELTSSTDQSGSLDVMVAVEDKPQPLTFSRRDPPTARQVTGAREIIRADEFWAKDSVNSFDVTETIREAYRSFVPDGTIALILSGEGTSYRRKYFYNSFRSRNAPKLTIRYTLPLPATPTPEPQSTISGQSSPIPQGTETALPSASPTPSQKDIFVPTATPKPEPTPSPTPFICIDC